MKYNTSSFYSVKDAVNKLKKDPSLLDARTRNEFFYRLSLTGNVSQNKIKKAYGIPEIETDLLTGPLDTSDLNRFKNKSDALKFINQALEGIDPKFKARKATEEFYRAAIDRPGSKQTRGNTMTAAYQSLASGRGGGLL